MKRFLLILAILAFSFTAHATKTGGPGVTYPEVWPGVAGQMYVSTGGTVTITTGGTFEKCDTGGIVWTSEHLEWFNESTDGRLTYTGGPDKYVICIGTGTVESGEIAQDVNLRLAENGTDLAASDVEITFTNQNLHTPVAVSNIIGVSTNDYIELYCTSDQMI